MERLNELQYTNGISSLVHFGDRIPIVEDSVIAELQECFPASEPMNVAERLAPADEVIIADGAFAGMKAVVLRIMPAKQRVQVLLDVLGRPTPVEVDRLSVTTERNTLADLAPVLAASNR